MKKDIDSEFDNTDRIYLQASTVALKNDLLQAKDSDDFLISTAALKNDLLQEKDFGDYLNRNKDNMLPVNFRDYLKKLLAEKQIRIADVVKRSGLDRTYTYQIFKGRKNASRDHLIAIAFGLGLDLEETRKMLKASGNRELYVRDERDVIIFLALRDKKTVAELDIDLYDNGFEPLVNKNP